MLLLLVIPLYAQTLDESLFVHIIRSLQTIDDVGFGSLAVVHDSTTRMAAFGSKADVKNAANA
jgi:hypothetical protein